MRNKIFYGWIIAGAGFVVSVIGIGMRYSFGVFLESIETNFAMSRAATSSIFSIYMVLCSLMAVFGGWAMDKYGPRKIGIFMGTFTGLSLLFTSLVQSSWQLFITYSLLLSLGTGPIYGVINTTASRWFIKKRGFVVGITSSGGGVGAIVFAPLATYLISNFDWRTAFIVLGGIAWIGIVAASLFLVKEPGDLALFPDGVKAGSRQEEYQKKDVNNQTHGISLGRALRMNQFWFLGFIWLSLSLSLHMIFVHVIPYAVGTGISPMEASYILSLMGISNIPGRLLIGKISDIFGRKSLGIICALIQFGSLLWLMGSSQLWMLYIFAIVYGFLWGGVGAIITAVIGDIFGTGRLGIIMGMISGGWALGAAIGPAIGGFIFDVSGDYFIAFGACAAALITAAFLLGLIRRVQNDSVPC
ncbi:MAG: MFS transporter [Deltaproteobacteria bacterium]|nr:MFS transporter [Deltaproteobacteria bacterium]